MAVSVAEARVCRHLRPALAGLEPGSCIPHSDDLQEALRALEWFIPELLSDFRESLDGIYPFTARKAGERGAELFGMCILLSDQTLVPLQLTLRLSPDHDAIGWIECRLGEQLDGKMQRVPYDSLNKMSKRFWGSRWGPETILWSYTVTRGEKSL